ncbi:MAG: hypothetical protein HQL66_11630 [Magnetococcales bacterium]|nr:hypothetical protein [Magnetococcales bacterium]
MPGFESGQGVIYRRRSPRSRLYAMFSYLSVLCLVPLILNKDDEYVHFHARQGTVLWVWMTLSILALHIPVIGPVFFSFSALLVALLSLVGIVSVLFSRAWRIPLISALASKI